MFQSTRIKLTAWYLLIIMTVSLLFSLAIYTGINQEFNRIEQREKLRIEEEQQGANRFFTVFVKERQAQGLTSPKAMRIGRSIDAAFIQQSRIRILATLAIVNSSIFLFSAVLGYFLAGRTLRPIKVMVDEQNRFITDASHEIRTPLTALKAGIEVHLRDKNVTLSQAKKLLESNLEEVNNLQTLSDNLIHLTQYPNGHTKHFGKVMLSAVLSEATKKIQSLATKKHIVLLNKISDDSVIGDQASLTELFVILLDNAIKYSEQKTTITISSKKTDGKFVVLVADQGKGIDPKDQSHIFDRFYRVDTSRTKNDESGYGLGLSIAKHIVKVHQGTISVESTKEKGTTFFITLPKKQ